MKDSDHNGESMHRIVGYCDGKRSYQEIADLSGLHRNTVYRLVKQHNLPRNQQGGQRGKMVGKNNPSYSGGRHFQPNGYVMVLAPYDHPYRPNTGYMSEHRLVMEKKLGRYLLPDEVVDHIDGLRLNNAPENLRLYNKNGDHLRVSLTGKKKRWSKAGLDKLRQPHHLRSVHPPVNKYREMIRSGDYLLLQILLAALSLGIDSPFLLGSHYHLEKAGIDHRSRSMIEQALDDLLRRWEQDLLR